MPYISDQSISCGPVVDWLRTLYPDCLIRHPRPALPTWARGPLGLSVRHFKLFGLEVVRWFVPLIYEAGWTGNDRDEIGGP